jgi:PDZ domain-containing protein/carboxypeptidase family protein
MNARRILVGACVLGVLLPSAVGAVFLSRVRTPPSPNGPQPAASSAVWAPAPPPAADDRTPEIRGRILDAEGNAVDGARVRLVSASAPYRVDQDTLTDSTGRFSLAHVPSWGVRVVAEHGADGVATSAALHVAEKQTVEITLVLSAASAVRGTVVDVHDRPLAGVVLSVEGVPWIVRATSDAAGSFRLTTVPDLATGLVAEAIGFKTGRVSLAMGSDQAERVVRVVLTAADPVGGEVRDDDGNPASARVVACEDEPSEVRTQSAADGSFELPPSVIGCDAVAEHAEFAPSDAARVVGGGHLMLRLKAGGGIAGVVVDERGAARSPFRVGIESFLPARGKDFERSGARSFTDPQGAFRWDKLAPGTYTLTASAAGRPPARSGSIEVRAGALTSGVRIVLAQGGALVGTVTDETRAPLVGVDLRFDQVSRVLDNDAVAQTNGAGQYRLEGAPAGLFTVRAHKDGFRVKLVSGLHVDSGATLRRDFTLVALDGGPTMDFGGIGAGIVQAADGLALQNVFPDDPAARAGLHAGDRIVSIDGEPTDGMSVADALQLIRGEPGTTVGLSVRRPETGEIVDRTVVRGQIVH